MIGFSTTDSVQLLLISNGMSIPARPLIGFVANRHVGAMNTYIVVTVAFGILTLAWMGVRDRVGMYVFTVFFGLANGLCQGMFLGSLASLTQDASKMGTRMGMVHTIVAFATLAGPPVSLMMIMKMRALLTNDRRRVRLSMRRVASIRMHRSGRDC